MAAGTPSWGVPTGPALASGLGPLGLCGVGVGMPSQARRSLGWAVAVATAGCSSLWGPAPPPPEWRCFPLLPHFLSLLGGDGGSHPTLCAITY